MGIAEPARSIEFEGYAISVRQQSELTVACDARLMRAAQPALMDRFRRVLSAPAAARSRWGRASSGRAVGGRAGRTVRRAHAADECAAGKISGRRRLWTRIDARMERVEVDVTFAAELRPGDRLEDRSCSTVRDTTSTGGRARPGRRVPHDRHRGRRMTSATRCGRHVPRGAAHASGGDRRGGRRHHRAHGLQSGHCGIA